MYPLLKDVNNTRQEAGVGQLDNYGRMLTLLHLHPLL